MIVELPASDRRATRHPDQDGYALARTLRQEYGASPVLIAATGYGLAQDRLTAKQAGFDVHLVKPVSIRELVRVLDERVVALDR